jgi:hypothetical protein
MTPDKILDREPVLFLAVVQAIVTLVTAFGLNLDGQQVAAINLVTIAILSLIARARVTPV